MQMFVVFRSQFLLSSLLLLFVSHMSRNPIIAKRRSVPERGSEALLFLVAQQPCSLDFKVHALHHDSTLESGCKGGEGVVLLMSGGSRCARGLCGSGRDESCISVVVVCDVSPTASARNDVMSCVMFEVGTHSVLF